MDWRMDTWGMLMWVSPFRHLRIKGYLLLPVAFRSLSRLSSALSAKASTLRSFLLDLVYSFYSVRNWVFAFNNADRIASILNFRSFGLVVNFVYDILGCLDKKSFSSKSSVWSFQGTIANFVRSFRNISIFQCFCYCLTEYLSVIRNLNVLKSLITGKTSFIRTTLPCWNRLAPSRLTLDARSICNKISAKKPLISSNANTLCLLFNLAATCFPIPSPV